MWGDGGKFSGGNYPDMPIDPPDNGAIGGQGGYFPGNGGGGCGNGGGCG